MSVNAAIPNAASILHENAAIGYGTVTLPDQSAVTMGNVVDRLERQPGIASAEQTVTLHAFAQPNDPRIDSQCPQQVNAPTAWDYDEGSYTADSQEQITVDLSGGEAFGLLVDAYSASGSYTLSVEELGQ